MTEEMARKVADDAIKESEAANYNLDKLLAMFAASYYTFMNRNWATDYSKEHFIRANTIKTYIIENFGKR